MDTSTDSSKLSIASLPRRCAMVIAVAASIIFVILTVVSIANSTVSTAAIGYIVLPVAAFVVFIVSGVCGFFIGRVIQGALGRNYRYSFGFLLSIIISLTGMIYSAPFAVGLSSTYSQVNKVSGMNSQQLDQEFANLSTASSNDYDIYVLAAIAQNPNASSGLLDKIAHLNHPQLNEKLGSIMGLTKNNRKGYATIRLVAMNPNVSLRTLEYMTDSNNYYLLGDIARNPELPVEYLRKLYIRSQNNQEGYLIEWGLAYNPNTPPEILRELSKKIKYGTGFDVINSALKGNSSTPSDVKEKLFD